MDNLSVLWWVLTEALLDPQDPETHRVVASMSEAISK